MGDLSLIATKRLLQDTKLRAALPLFNSLNVATEASPKPRETVKLSTTTTVGEALKILASYNILSAPVSDQYSNEYVGILDVFDALTGLLAHVYPELLKEGYVAAHKRLSMTELQNIGIEYSSQPIAALVHGGDLWYKGDRESTLAEVVASGFRVGLPPGVHSPHHHLRVHHRVAVFDIIPGEQTPDGPVPEWRVTDVVSQTDVLRLLAAKMEDLTGEDKGLGASLAAHGLVQGAGKVAVVTADTPTLSVLAKMQQERLSGVGVVGELGGPLLANLSASDVRGVTPERFGALALPVGTFLLLEHGGAGGVTYEDALLDALPPAVREGRWAEALAALPPVTCCAPTATLREAIELLVRRGKHRVYVVEEGNQPVGVVTPTDVLRVISMAPQI